MSQLKQLHSPFDVGESAPATQTAFGSIVPTVLGALTGLASTGGGVQQITRMLDSGRYDGGALADVSIEACGLQETYAQAFRVVRKLGTVVVFGVPHLEDTIPFDWGSAYYKLPNILVTNSSQSGERTRATAMCVDLVAQGRLDLSYLVTHRFTWDEIPLAFDMYSTQKGRALKGLVTVHP